METRGGSIADPRHQDVGVFETNSRRFDIGKTAFAAPRPALSPSANKRPIRHCERSEATQGLQRRLGLGCFAVARDDGLLDSITCRRPIRTLGADAGGLFSQRSCIL